MPSWRDHHKIHPAADLFPLMSETELRELGDGIKNYGGLREPVHLYKGEVLDGRNRLDAMEAVGYRFDVAKLSGIANHLNDTTDPYAYVIAANLHRRHLTPEQKRDLIAAVLRAKPNQSNVQIAKQVKADDKTVAKVRADLESTSEIPRLEKTTGKDGKARPAKVKKKSISVTVPPVPTKTVNGADPEAAPETVEEAEAEVKRLKALKATLKNSNTDKIAAPASAKALAGCKGALDDWLPKMNADDLQAIIDYFAEAVEVSATELMPDLKEAQWNLRIAKAEITALKRKLAGKLPPRESRADRWQRCVDEGVGSVEELISMQAEFEEAGQAQPDNLQGGAFAQKCEEICGIDLESALSALQEAADAEVPLGFGRD